MEFSDGDVKIEIRARPAAQGTRNRVIVAGPGVGGFFNSVGRLSDSLGKKLASRYDIGEYRM
jgi:hypothetical protein